MLDGWEVHSYTIIFLPKINPCLGEGGLIFIRGAHYLKGFMIHLHARGIL